jgi:hypothetical protein
MKELRFTQSYTRDNERTYVKLPFDMPGGIERIEVEYGYPRILEEKLPEGRALREANCVDLGIYDPRGALYGWSGSNRSSFFISSTAATPGYRHGVLEPGRWALALGLYRIESSLTVEFRLRMYPRERKWYIGDLHLHTRNSDGAYATAPVIGACEKAGLDFAALTDHNNMKQNSEIGNPEGLSVIPGVEFTNYRGHANFFFADPGTVLEADFLSNSFAEMAALFRRAKEAGALISLNHPVSNCPWEFGFEGFPFDMVEVWNGPMTGANLRSLSLWDELLRQGRRISAVGGSDTHVHELGRTFGSPCTRVLAGGPAPADLLAGLAAGRASAAFQPRGPWLDLEIAGAGLGEAVPFRPGLEGRAVVSGAAKGDVLRVINREGIAHSFTAPFSGVYTPSFPVEDLSYYRLELYRPLLDAPVLCGLSNPVYIGER